MSTLTVYFDDPWWVGVIEEVEDGSLRAYRHVFGSEPTTGEILNFVLTDLADLIQRSSLMVQVSPVASSRSVNPKRANREAAQQMLVRGASTKAQEALRLQVEQNKQERRVQSKDEREAEAAYKRQKAREKALARKRGH